MKINQFFSGSLVLLGLGYSASAQNTGIPYNKEYYNFFEKSLYEHSADFHTSVKPYLGSEVEKYVRLDTAFLDFYFKKYTAPKNIWYRKARREHLLTVNTKDFKLAVDPVMHFEYAKDSETQSSSMINTRGVTMTGTIGKQVSFTTSFFENQAEFIYYINNYTFSHNVVPGQGIPKITNASKDGYYRYDYSQATGVVGFSPSKYFNFQLGQDKVFIGDGYRSLFLSDNSFSAPFFKITTNVWKIQYVNLYTQYQDIRYRNNDLGFRKKNASMHHLSYNVTKWLNIGAFEAIMFRGKDSLGNRGYDVAYFNPIIFYRPVEFGLGSPDNALLGIDFKATILKRHILYGQLILDEFKFDEVKSGKGWSNNKQGFQLGAKVFEPLNMKNLNLLLEYNYVRPFTYSHDTPNTNYGHYNQPLAHTLSSNFSELVAMGSYRYKSILLSAKVIAALRGIDANGKNYGNDIYKSYLTAENAYGNKVGQAYSNKFAYADIKLAYIINPNYNLQLYGGYVYRSASSIVGNELTSMLYFGLRTAIVNHYYDF